MPFHHKHVSRPTCWLLACLLFAAGCIGCTDGSRKGASGKGGSAVAEGFVLGDLIPDRNFKPPTLEELEKTVEWVDQPVLDGMKLMRERQAGEEVLATVKEALALRNDSPEANARILSALGRLPESDEAVNFDDSITRHSLQALNNVNPLLGSSTTEFEVSGLTNFGLFGFDWNFTPFASADTVVSWQTSSDGLYDKVVLRDDLTWSDGEPITAHDVVFSYQVILTNAVPIRAVRSGTDKIKWIEAYDDHTVVFFHIDPLATNVWNVNFPIIPKHKFEMTIGADPTLVDSDEHVKLEESPVVGGAYEIVSRSKTEIVLERREAYYVHEGKQVRDKPYFKQVRLRINPDSSTALLGLKAGDIDEMLLEAPQWQSQTGGDDYYDKNTKAYGLEWVTFSFFWNTESPFFSDRRVRWAMSYAFDHDEMINTYRYGRDEPCTGTFHGTSRWHPGEKNAVRMIPEPLKQDREKAKQLLDEAGWVDSDGDGYRDKEIDGRRRKFSFSVLVRNQKERVDICELLKQNLKVLGVECNVRTLESATLQDKMFNREFEAAYGGWGTGADPDTSENIWGSKENRNYVSYKNPMVDEMFGEGRKLKKDRKKWSELQLWQDEEMRAHPKLDPDLADEQPEREDCYAAIHALLWHDQPYTWLFYRNSYYGFNKRIRGIIFSPRGPFGYSPGFSSVWSPAE